MQALGRDIELGTHWHIPAAITLHACLLVAVSALQPEIRQSHRETSLDLSLLEILQPAPGNAPEDEPEPSPQPPPETEPAPRPVAVSSTETPAPVMDTTPATPSRPDQSSASSGAPDAPVINLPGVSEDWLIEDNGVWFGASNSEASEEQNALRALSCFRLGRTDEDDPRCDQLTSDGMPDSLQIARNDPLTATNELEENPFASAFDLFSEGQYADRSTTYSLYNRRNSDHQHANPFFSYQSSAERDLTGSLNSAPDPVWGD